MLSDVGHLLTRKAIPTLGLGLVAAGAVFGGRMLLFEVSPLWAILFSLVCSPLILTAYLIAMLPHLPRGRRLPTPWRRFGQAYLANVFGWLRTIGGLFIPLVGLVVALKQGLGTLVAPILALEPDVDEPVEESLGLIGTSFGAVLGLGLLITAPGVLLILMTKFYEVPLGAGLLELNFTLSGTLMRLVMWMQLTDQPVEGPAEVASIFE